MRIVVCINPHVPLEHFIKGSKYAERSIGTTTPVVDINDNFAIARVLRDIADTITPDPENTGRDEIS